MSDPLVQLDFFDPWDINGDVIFTMTDQDTYFEKLELDIELSKLGGAVLTTSRRVGHAMFRSGIYAPEVFVRVLIPSIDEEKYLWGFFIDLRKQKLISKGEDGGEIFTIGGPGPMFYLTRGALMPEETGDTSAWVNVGNWVYHWAETATAGRILNSIIRMVTTADPDALPDLTKSFTASLDSNGDAWVDDISGTDDFELPIGQSVLADFYDIQDVSDTLEATISLGEVGDPIFELNAYQSLGRNLVAASVTDLADGVVHFKERVNIEDDLDADGTSLRKYSHVIVRGMDSSYVVVPRTSWDPGEYVKVGMIEYTRSKNTTVLERRGLKWLRHQDAGENEINFEIKPGFDPENGLYMPGPDGTNGHAWLGDAVSLTTGSDPTEGTWTPLDYRNETQRLMGWNMELDSAVNTDTAEKAALSWHVKPQLNVERQSDNGPKAGDGSGTGTAECKCLRLCIPGKITPEEVQYDLNWPNVAGIPAPEVVTVWPSGTGDWPTAGASRVQDSSSGAGTPTSFDPGDPDLDGTGYVVAGGAFGGNADSPKLPANPGSDYRFQFKGRSSGVPQGLAGVDFYDAADIQLATYTNSITGTLWQDFDVTYTAPAGTAYMVFRAASPAAFTRSFYDKVRVTVPEYVQSVNDGNPALIGTDGRAKRCDSTEHLLSDRDPTEDDDEHLGFPVNTLWINTDSGQMWVLVDSTEGAAVWLALTGGGTDLSGINFLVGTASGDLTSEIVVGTTPGGELGGTWGSPTVDSTHSGSAHHAQDHASRHANAGADAVKLDDLATPDDNTDLNASTSQHGLLRKLDNDPDHYLDGQGNWTEPPGTGGGSSPITDAGDMIYGGAALQNEALSVQSATFDASTTYLTFAASRAFDEDDSTEWGAVNEPAGEWLRTDLGSAKAILKWRVQQGGAGNRADVYKLQSSTDNSSWTDRHTISGTTADTGVIDLASGTISARYWRILAVSDSVSGGWTINSFELYSLSGTTGEVALPIGDPAQHLVVDPSGLMPEWADQPKLEELLTDETDTSLVPHPDGAGNVVWGTDASGGSGSASGAYDAIIDAVASLVSHWKLDEDAGTTLADHDGVNDMTLHGGYTLDEPGKLADNAAILLNGSSGYADDTSTTGLPTGAGARSMEVWYKGTSTSKQTLMSYGTASTRQSFSLVINDGGDPKVGYWTYGDDASYAATGLLDGAWHHLALTYDGSTTMKVYMDGVLLGTGTLGASLNTVVSGAGFVLGKDHHAGSAYGNGTLDEPAIYSAALSQGNLQAHIDGATPAVTGSPLLPLDAAASAAIGSGDDFSGTSLDGGWSSLQATALTTVDASIEGYLVLGNSAAVGNDALRGIDRAFSPSGDFTIWARVDQLRVPGQFVGVAVFAGASNPINDRIDALIYDSGPGDLRVQINKWTSATRSNIFDASVGATPLWLDSGTSGRVFPTWIALRRVGSNLSLGVSQDGIEFTWHTTTTTISFTVDTCGISLLQQGTSLDRCAFVDYIATAG